MKADIVIRAQVDTGKDSIRCAQWIAEEIRDFALHTLGVTEAHVSQVKEVSPDASV